MTKDSAPTPVDPKKPKNFNVVAELADTTWRMAVPVLLFAGIGLFVDTKLDSAPWLTLLGMLIGFYFAALLVIRQIKRGKES